jgi:hypothetical protein
MQSHYHLLSTADVRENEDSIIETLDAIMSNKLVNDIRLLNYYREVPISFKGLIDFIDRGIVEMSVHQLQAVLMGEQKEVLLRSAHLANDVLAKVNMVRSDLAFLSHFSYVQITADRRSAVRVGVTDKIEAAFEADGCEVQGRLVDISTGGMAFLVEPGSRELNEALKGNLAVSLQGRRVCSPGLLLNQFSQPPGDKFAFQLMPNTKVEEVISHFVFQTQSEIIRELKERAI